MDLKELTKRYRVWIRVNGKKCCSLVEAQNAQGAKDKVKTEYPEAKIGYAILVSK